MTREEAIKILADLTDNLFLHTWEEQYKALHMAIEALQQPQTDLIGRADAVKAIRKCKIESDMPSDWYKGMETAQDIISALPSAEAVQGYAEWLEKIIIEAEIEWLCEDATDEEWCEKNCNYASIQTECLRHLYEVSKGGDD